MSANHVLIASIETTSLTNYVTFSNIPQTGFSDLKIVMAGRDSGDDLVRFSMAFNATSKQTFTRRVLYGVGTGTGSSTLSTNTSIGYGTVRNTGTANTYGNCEILIPNYSSSNAKSFLVEGAEENNSADAIMGISSGYTTTTDPIRSISIFSDAPYLAIGSKFSLYGIASVSKEPELSPKAYGGDIVANDGEYWYHAFLYTGVFKPKSLLNCDVLVVAGGGGGGGSASGNAGAGGGGAGGLRTATGISLSSPQIVTIGAGGSGASRTSIPTKGIDSSFYTITSAGGGNASSAGLGPAGSGGSGGGGTGDFVTGGTGNTPSTSPAQGFNGGTTVSGAPYCGAGGGGATQAGGVGQSAGNGYGGTGSAALSSWAYATGTGASGYFAGGGGGGGSNSGSGASAGGAGGGGAGSNSGTATSGTANTGGGGGGVGGGAGSGNGGNGGSGIVIVRYAMA